MKDFAPTSAILPFDPELLASCQAISQYYRELPDLNFAELRRDRGNITDQQFEAEEATYDQCVVGIRAEMNKIFELAQLDLQRLQAFMHASHLALVRLRDILDAEPEIENVFKRRHVRSALEKAIEQLASEEVSPENLWPISVVFATTAKLLAEFGARIAGESPQSDSANSGTGQSFIHASACCIDSTSQVRSGESIVSDGTGESRCSRRAPS